MQFVGERKALYEAFQHAGSVLTSTVARPVYQNVKLEATGDHLLLSATDLEVGLMLRVDEVEIAEDGSVLVPEGRVSSILRATPDEKVSFSGGQDAIKIESSDSTFRVPAESPEEFRGIPELDEEGVLEIDPDLLDYMVTRTVFATAEEKGRYALHGIQIVVDEDGTIEMVAADGARLALVKKKAANPAGVKAECIVVRKGLEHLRRLAKLADEPLKLQIKENQLRAENSRGRVTCQLIEGQFPPYRDVIPRETKIKLDLDTRLFLNAVSRAALMTTDRARVVNFKLSEDMLELTAQSPDVGEAQVRMPMDYKQEDVTIAFNPEFIEDVLRAIERESVKFQFTDERSPCVIKSGSDYLYVVSPVVREEPG